MIGGIYCEIPLGKVYIKNRADSINSKAAYLFGKEFSALDAEDIDRFICDKINDAIRRYFSQRRGIGYEDKKGVLKNSYGYAVYNMDDNPKLRVYDNAPFTDGSSEYVDEFIEEYKPLTRSGWMVLLCAAAPYAARTEAIGSYPNGAFQGHNKKVLISMVYGMSQRIREVCGSKSETLKYGYILNSLTHETVGKRLKLI